MEELKELLRSYVLELEDIKRKKQQYKKLFYEYQDLFEKERQANYILQEKVAELERDNWYLETQVKFYQERQKEYMPK